MAFDYGGRGASGRGREGGRPTWVNGRKSSGRKDGEKLRFLIELGKMGGKVGGEVEVGRGRMREAPSELMLLVLAPSMMGFPLPGRVS